jgi:hypothetical protein
MRRITASNTSSRTCEYLDCRSGVTALQTSIGTRTAKVAPAKRRVEARCQTPARCVRCPGSPQREHLLVARKAVLACPIGVNSVVFVEI